MEFTELHPELRPYLRSSVLEHPLVAWPYAFPAYYSRLNSCYIHKLELLSGVKQPNEWDRYFPELTSVQRMQNYAEELFSEDVCHESRFTSERLKFFGQCWTSPDVIAQSSSFCEMFFDAPFDRDVSAVMTEHELDQWSNLPDEMEVYRASRQQLVQGCCWYPDHSVAAAWATLPWNGFISSARIRRKFVRALFNRRGETELILQNGRVTDICTTPLTSG